MKLTARTFESLVPWGQYLHWAELQFSQFKKQQPEIDSASAIGATAHWLAAEYVVLEGWEELGLQDDRITRLLATYPEHRDILRRCRNAVYHYQPRVLDPRLAKCLKNEDEELRWCVALHFEFQRVLLGVAGALFRAGDDGTKVAESLARAIGWLPTHPFAEPLDRVRTLCEEFEALLGEDDSPLAADARSFIETIRRDIRALDLNPVTSALNRMAGTNPTEEPRDGDGV